MEKKGKEACASGEGEICLCPLEGVMGVISKRWALLILAAIGNHGKLRYGELMKKLGSISPKSLSDRLKELGEAGVIERHAFAEIPPRVEYSLTKDGQELRKAMLPLMEWIHSRTHG